MSRTDAEWEKWGARDPYFGVLTDERFRADRITEAVRDEFFLHGFRHVDAVLRTCRGYFGDGFAPRSVLDFGCGVGRLLVPFAQFAPRVVGVDVSPSMLAEARRNCDARNAAHVALVRSDDGLSGISERFDFVHSTMVLQHIEPHRGRLLVRRLLECIGPGGGAALHLTYGKAWFAEHFGQAPPAPAPAPPPVESPWSGWRGRIAKRLGRTAPPAAQLTATPPETAATADPEMNMYSYHLSEIAFLVQSAGASRFHAEFSDHGGELGVMIYLSIPPADGIGAAAAP